jgi:hypothetical protein
MQRRAITICLFIWIHIEFCTSVFFFVLHVELRDWNRVKFLSPDQRVEYILNAALRVELHQILRN